MTIECLIGRIINLPGNLERGNSTYVTADNMDRFSDQLIEVDAEQGILITPYLISKEGILYELHYYEFDIEVRDNKSYFVDYNENNTLPKEIIDNLKPQVIISMGDSEFYHKVVKEYLSKMSTMHFEEDMKHYPLLQNAKLYYQIFIDSDLS